MVRLTELSEVVALNEAAAQGEEPDGLVVELRDGSRALLRPIRVDDKDRLQRGLALLSPRSRFLRFHTHLESLSDEQLIQATEIDHRTQVAWVALDADNPDVPGMALGQYARLETAPEVAEASITVADHYQGRGLGTVMLAVLAEVALANGIRVFRNYVLAENATMLEVFDQLGAERQLITEQVYEVDFALPTDLEQLPDTPAGRAMRALAHQEGPSPLLAGLSPAHVFARLRRRRDAPGEPPLHAADQRERGELSDWVDAALSAPSVDEPASEDVTDAAG